MENRLETVLVDVALPASGRHYEVRLPVSMNTLVAAHLTAEALAALSEGTYRPSRSSVLARGSTGRLLDVHKTLAQENVRNADTLLLI